MVQQFKPHRKDDEIKVQMNITVDLPAEVAKQAEELGIYEFERCVYDPDTCRMTASVTTTEICPAIQSVIEYWYTSSAYL